MGRFPLSSDGTVAQELITVNDRENDAHYDAAPDQVLRLVRQDHRFYFHCANGICLELTGLNESMFRFRYSIDGSFAPDFSYAVDPGFTPAPPSFQMEEQPDRYVICTKQLRCVVHKNPLRIQLTDADGRSLLREKNGFYSRRTILRGVIRMALSLEKTDQDRFYGLGDKAGDLCLNGKTYENWNTDAFSFHSESDPLYKSIPFFYGMREDRAFGLFLDNTYRSRFDFGHKKKDEWQFETAGGEMRYYFIYGPKLPDIAIQYAKLTGTPELPPLWALGFHQSRWSYFPEARVREVARTFRERNIPCDAIYLDIDYMDGFRCFTWDLAHFPDPAPLISELAALGLKTVVMIDPGIKIDPEYGVYREGMEKDVFCYRTDGELMKGPVWPQECVFPDFTNPRVRAWWGELYRTLYTEQGVAGFWNDMNEPAIFKIRRLTFPDEVRHDYDGQLTNHQKAHNIYGQQMSRATQQGLKKLDPERRPFVLTRASFAGGQRYAATWTGDNMANWEHLRIAHRQTQRLSISGYGFSGSDIGGFSGEPDGELLLRWLQMGAFHPFFRIHSMGNNLSGTADLDSDWVHEQEALNRLDQEPWAFGPDWENLNRQAIEWRYRWLPYLYSAFRTWIQQGTPLLRSLLFWDQTDPKLFQYEDGVWFGPHVLIFPVFRPGQKTKTVYLPKGDWLDYWTGKLCKGGKKHRVAIRLDRIPIYVAAGAIIPHHPVRPSTAYPVEELSLRLYPGSDGTCHGEMYEDAGEGYGYRNGAFSLLRFQGKKEGNRLTLGMQVAGNYALPYSRLRVWMPGRRELIFDPFPGMGKDPGFELSFEIPE